MTKRKNPIKKITVPKIENKTNNKQTEAINRPKNKGSEIWDSILDIGMTDKLKLGINNIVNSTNTAIYDSMTTSNNTTHLTKEMLTKISANISNSIEQSMELGQDFLKCKTAIDVIDLQRKAFENSFLSTTKLYSDLTHAIQTITTENMRYSSNTIDKNAKLFTN